MSVVLLRIGIDTGSGGIHGPLFADGTFEYIPIPDGKAVDERTYGNDTGFAPNPFGRCCTLATCKPKIRRHARRGDWVIGVGSPNNVGNGRLVHAMRVDEVLTLEQYDADSRFVIKKPNPAGQPEEQCGDNIYYKNRAGEWQQRPSFHQPKHMERDLGGKNVLISSHFFYFGSESVIIPPKLAAVIHQGIGHSCHFPEQLVVQFLEWLHDN